MAASNGAADARKFDRHVFETVATATIYPVCSSTVAAAQVQECFVITQDLSRGGVSFFHPKALAKGQRIDIAFANGREAAGVVQWTKRIGHRKHLIGCRFTSSVLRLA